MGNNARVTHARTLSLTHSKKASPSASRSRVRESSEPRVSARRVRVRSLRVRLSKENLTSELFLKRDAKRHGVSSLAFLTLIPVPGNLAFPPLSCAITSRVPPTLWKQKAKSKKNTVPLLFHASVPTSVSHSAPLGADSNSRPPARDAVA